MRQLVNLLKWDVLLLNRNNFFMLGAIVAAIYIGVFYLIKPIGNLTILLVVLIFNDPIVTGYLFAAILLLFDKNQNTLQAISVLPLTINKYLLSKAIILSVLATVTSFIMAYATKGIYFNHIHLLFATFFSAFIFSCFGFAISAVSKTFNQLLFYSIPFFIISAVPFLSIFEYGEIEYFLLFPSAGGIGIIKASFDEVAFTRAVFLYVHLLCWSIISWWIAVKTVKQQLS